MQKKLILILIAINLTLQKQEIEDTKADYFQDPPKKLTIKYQLQNNLSAFMIIGLFLTFLSNVLTNYIGVTGAGMLFSLLIFFFGFPTKQAIPIYKFCNLMAAFINLIYIFSTRNSENKNELYLDWNLSAFCIPILVTGSMIGVLISEYFPAVYLLGTIVLILVFVLILTFKMQSKENEEKDKIKQDEPELTPLIQNDKVQEKRISIFRIFFNHKCQIITILFSFVCLILGNLLKGSPEKPSIFFTRCSIISFVFYILFLIFPTLLGLQKSPILVDKYERSKLIQIGIYTMISGFITSFGISGSLIFTSSLVILKLKPLVLTSISRLTMFMSSLAAVIQFYISGSLDIEDALIIGILSVVGSIVGLCLFAKFQRNKNPHLVRIILQIILVLSIILMPFLIWFEVKHNPNAENFGGIC